jgi:hypothetical protein
MRTGITAGPEGSGAHELVHYVYERRHGRILASYHFLGDKESTHGRAEALLREAADAARVPLEELDVLELEPAARPTGYGELRVDPERRELIVYATDLPPHAKP